MANSFIRLSDVQRRTGYSKAWIYRLIKQERFPMVTNIKMKPVGLMLS